MLDFNGAVITASTPNGLDGWFHDIVHDQRHGFAVFHAPTATIRSCRSKRSPPCGRSCRVPKSRCKNWTRNSSTPAARRSSRWLRCSSTASLTPTTFHVRRSGLRSTATAEGRPRSRRLRGGDLRLTCLAWRRIHRRCALRAVDWDIQSLAQGGVGPWLQHVRGWHGLVPASKAARRTPVSIYRGGRQGYAIIEMARPRQGTVVGHWSPCCALSARARPSGWPASCS